MVDQGVERVSLSDVRFPLRVRVRAEVWAPAFVMAVVLWVLFVPIILGVPSSVFDGESAMLLLLRVLAGIGFLPLSLYVVYTWMAWRRPRHLTVDEDAVWTDSWRVRWKDVESVWLNPTHGQAPDKKTRIGFMVEDHAWTDELRRGNRWDSGYPFGLGGLLPKDNVVLTQFATDPPIQSLFELFEELRMQARGETPEDRSAPE